MNDCPNAEMRDLLPELLHDRLSATVRAEVTAHVDACADCREERELLRGLREVMVTYTPKIDVAYVVSALPAPPTQSVRIPRRPRTWADWRVAAAVTLIAVGGTSVAVVARGGGGPADTVVMVPVPVSRPTRGTAFRLRMRWRRQRRRLKWPWQASPIWMTVNSNPSSAKSRR